MARKLQAARSRLLGPRDPQCVEHDLALPRELRLASRLVVTAALDNLDKGASGQGVECFNIACGFDRTTALEIPVQWP